jgi:hypothetical protein
LLKGRIGGKWYEGIKEVEMDTSDDIYRWPMDIRIGLNFRVTPELVKEIAVKKDLIRAEVESLVMEYVQNKFDEVFLPELEKTLPEEILQD